jgi:hypothetical protein
MFYVVFFCSKIIFPLKLIDKLFNKALVMCCFKSMKRSLLGWGGKTFQSPLHCMQSQMVHDTHFSCTNEHRIVVGVNISWSAQLAFSALTYFCLHHVNHLRTDRAAKRSSKSLTRMALQFQCFLDCCAHCFA